MFEVFIDPSVRSCDGIKPELADLARLDDALATTPRGERIALDTETTSTRATESFLVGFSISCGGRNFYCPVSHKKPNVMNDDLTSAISILRAKLPGREIAFHNAPFDLIVLDRHGLDLSEIGVRIFDTEIAAHLTDSTRRRVGESNRLKDLSKRLLDIKQRTYEEVAGDLGFDYVDPGEGAVYACFDTYCTLKLSHLFEAELRRLRSFSYFRKIEMENVWNTTEMIRNGVPIDVNLLYKMMTRADGLLRLLERSIFRVCGRPVELNSPEQLGSALFALRNGVRKFMPLGKTASGAFDTSGGTLRSLSRREPKSKRLVKALLHYRKVKRLKVAYLSKILHFLNHSTGRVHPSLSPSTITGRYRCSSPNLLGLPKKYVFDFDKFYGREPQETDDSANASKKRKPIDLSVRQLIRASPGCKLVVSDFSQIDMRGIAHYSRDEKLLKALKQGRDLHLLTLGVVDEDELATLACHKCDPKRIVARDEETLSLILDNGKPIIIPEQNFCRLEAKRKEMKAVNFGISYGMGPTALVEKLNNPENIDDLDEFLEDDPWTLEDAKRIFKSFFNRFPKIPSYKEEVRKFFLGQADASNNPPASYRNVFGRTVFSAPYFRIWAAPVVTIDVRTSKGPVRLRGKVLVITEEGITFRLHHAVGIKIPKHPPLSHEMSQAEKDRIKKLHDDAEIEEPIFECDNKVVEKLERTIITKLPLKPPKFFQFERALASCCVLHPSDRAAFLAKESFHPTLRVAYEKNGLEAPSSLPYILIAHKEVDAVRLSDDARFIRYARWTGALRELTSYVISSTSTDIAKKAMIAVRKEITRRWPERYRDFRLLLCIHDELIYEVPQEFAVEFKTVLRRVMARKPHPRFIAKVDAKPGIGDNYEEAKP